MSLADSQLLSFLNRLRAAKIHYSVEHIRNEAILVHVVVPGERWEIEFMASGTVEVEIFKSDGSILGDEALITLFENFSD